ncbi:MAG: zinc ribbon domain-containing protein [Armatimonadetes bacterium]|nr:zinc ribbon domain-containing protein [Armatimonadota bacterium]
MPLALVVALGGTGHQIVTAVRRRICDAYGAVERALPCQRYLYLDTDAGELGGGESGYADPADVNLASADKKAITVTGLAQYMSDPQAWLDNHPHIKVWAPPQAICGNIDQGAGSVRARGRLGLVWNYNIAAASLQTAYNALRDTTSIDRLMTEARQTYGHRARVNQALPLQVYIVGSVRGGTGSGTFTDVAYIMGKIANNQAGLTGLVVLPDPGVDPTNDGNLRNALGALTEVNHWSYNDTAYGAEFGSTVVEATIDPNRLPPFRYLYLVSRKRQSLDESHSDLVGNSELIETCADALFYELVGDDASAAGASRRNDFDTLLQDPDYVGDPQSFLSLGVSLIRFPRERAKKACTWHFVAELLTKWNEAVAAFPQNVQAKVTDDTAKTFLNPEGLTQELTRHSEAGTIIQYRHNDAVRHGNSVVLAMRQERDIPAFVDRKVSEYRHTYLRNDAINQDPLRADPSLLGDDLKVPVGRYDAVLKQGKDQIDRLILSWSNLADMTSLPMVNMAVQAHARHLGGVEEACEREANIRNGRITDGLSSAERRRTIAYWEARREAAFRNMEDTVRSVWVRGLAISAWPMIRHAVRRYIRECHGLFDAIGQAFAWDCARKLAGDLLEYVGRWQQALTLAQTGVNQFITYARGESDNANKPLTETHNEELWRPAEREEKYSELIASDDAARNRSFEAAQARFLSDTKRQSMVIALLDMLGGVPRPDAEDMKRGLYAACLVPFAKAFNDVDALDRFWAKYPTVEARQARLKQLFSASGPLMALDSGFSDWERPTFGNKKRLFMLGVSPQSSRRSTFLQEAADANPAVRSRDPIDARDRSWVIIRQEIAGFPLASLGALEEMRAGATRSAAEAPMYSRIDVAEWRSLQQPPAQTQFVAWQALALCWLLTAARDADSLDAVPSPQGHQNDGEAFRLKVLGSPQGDEQGVHSIGFQLQYRFAGRRQSLQLGPVQLGTDEESTGASGVKSWFGRPGNLPPQRMPKMLRGMLQKLAHSRNSEAVRQMARRLRDYQNARGPERTVAVLEGIRQELAGDDQPIVQRELGPALESAIHRFCADNNLADFKSTGQEEYGVEWKERILPHFEAYPGYPESSGPAVPAPEALPAPSPEETTPLVRPCPKCQHENVPGAKFCVECGEELARPQPARCPACNAELHGGRHCPECGTRVTVM